MSVKGYVSYVIMFETGDYFIWTENLHRYCYFALILIMLKNIYNIHYDDTDW